MQHPTQFPLPDSAKVKAILELLYDGLEVRVGRKIDLSPASGSWIGTYVCDDGQTVALCACEPHLAAKISSALSMLPVPAAQEAAKTKQLDEIMVGNLKEIMNICSRLLMNDESKHLKLDRVYPAKSLPSGATGVLTGAKGRVDFEVIVPKYGNGGLALLSV